MGDTGQTESTGARVMETAEGTIENMRLWTWDGATYKANSRYPKKFAVN